MTSWSRSASRPGVDADKFFADFSAIVHDLAPKNRELLAKRDALQLRIDDWYRQHGAPSDMEAYQAFLREIGYLLPEGSDFQVSTTNVDPEIASIAGPQLVVPVMNARYALNAANARWGSLYDALYGTDAIPRRTVRRKGKGYNPKRGEKVIAWVRDFLDAAVPLADWSWKDVAGLCGQDGALAIIGTDGEHVSLKDAAFCRLSRRCVRADQCAAEEQRHPYRHRLRCHHGHRQERSGAYFRRLARIGDHDDHGLRGFHRRRRRRGQDRVYSNWLGLMKGDLQEEVAKGGSELHPQAQSGSRLHRPGWCIFRDASPLADADPQRRSPDDESGYP
jgi:malate synthase